MDAISKEPSAAWSGTDVRARLSVLWVFATLNYLYADVVTLMDKAVNVRLSQGLLLAASVLVETAIAMVLLSIVLPYRANRIANIAAGVINTLAVSLSLFATGNVPAAYYLFFAAIEIPTTLFIIWYAWRWQPGSREPVE